MSNPSTPTIRPGRRVAYIMSRFPKLTETFVLYEMLAMEQLGVPVEIYPLQRENTAVVHPEAQPLVQQARYTPFISPAILRANLHFLRHMPGRYLRTLAAVLKGNWGSKRYFAGALAFFPKAVYFARQMEQDGTEHVHAHFASHPALVAYIIHRLIGIPYSFTAHGSDIHRDQHMLREKVAKAAFVVPISEANRDFILRHSDAGQAEKMVVIHCGVDAGRFQPQPSINGRGPQKQPVPTTRPEDTFQLLCIGTLHEVKGQIYLILALQELRRRGVPAVVHFVGDGPDRAALEQKVAAAGLQPYVTFHGLLPRDQVIRRLHQADVLVAPSVPSRDGRREGIPVVLIEAMASGVPVVASRLSGIPELVVDGESGLLAGAGDNQELANALESLYSQPELRRRLAEAGRRKVLAEFDLHTNAARLAHHFQREVA